jgi:signal transduction histidine kinase
MSIWCEGRRRKLVDLWGKPIGALFAFAQPMSSLDNIYMKMATTVEPAVLTRLPQEQLPAGSEQQIGRDVAHELNNILTIIRGYADRMILKHGENPALRPELQLISDSARRAESVVRHASLPRPQLQPPMSATV